MTSAKICMATEFFFLNFHKLHKVLSISANFEVFCIPQSEIKKGGWGNFTPPPPHEQIRGQNITVEIGLKCS